jgi:hypothetical protein
LVEIQCFALRSRLSGTSITEKQLWFELFFFLMKYYKMQNSNRSTSANFESS